MRIALLHYTYAPVAGGVERVLADHARLWREAGHQVTELACEERPGWEAALRAALAQQEMVFLHNVLTMPFRLELTAALWHWIDELPHVRFLHWIHDVAVLDPAYENACAASVEGALLRQAHSRVEYIAVSESRREAFCQMSGLPLVKCRVIPNGVDPWTRLRLTPPVRAVAEAWRLLERELVLFHPARFVRRKNLEASVEVLAALVADGRDAVLVLTAADDLHASGPSQIYAGEIRAQVERHGLADRVCFVATAFALSGAAPTDADVDSLYTLADALLFLSQHEGFGLPVVEAALHRLLNFSLAIEPLTTLLPPGRLTAFSPQAAPSEIATEIMRQVEASRPIQSRKAAARQYGWPAVYRNFLAPLLAGSETSPPP